MRKFRIRHTVPPGGYSYKIPFSGTEVVAGDFASLVISIRNEYVRNGKIVPDNLAALVEHYICLNSPVSFCAGEYEPGDEQMRALNARAVKEASSFKKLRLKWPADKFLAPLAEAERRAAICVKCKLNSQGFCTTCHGLAGFVVDAIGDRKTSVDAQLGVCAVCSCLVKAKVHISAEALRAAPRQPDEGVYPASCWMYNEVLK